MNDAELAARLARETGERLVQLRERLLREDASPWFMMDSGDALAHRCIVDTLRHERPDDAILSEEGADDPRRLAAQRVWIVDPLDGTSEFGEGDRDDWAVHIALWQRTAGTHGELTAAAVGLPARGLTLATDPPPVVPAKIGRAHV